MTDWSKIHPSIRLILNHCTQLQIAVGGCSIILTIENSIAHICPGMAVLFIGVCFVCVTFSTGCRTFHIFIKHASCLDSALWTLSRCRTRWHFRARCGLCAKMGWCMRSTDLGITALIWLELRRCERARACDLSSRRRRRCAWSREYRNGITMSSSDFWNRI